MKQKKGKRPEGKAGTRPMEPTRLPSDREQALFEVGIKLGGLFHQFVGVPVSGTTAGSLEKAIEEAVSLQPYVKEVHIEIDPERGGPVGSGRHGYRYLTAPMLLAEIVVEVGGARVKALLSFREDLKYPLMRVVLDEE
jgi:hypothetical protein